MYDSTNYMWGEKKKLFTLTWFKNGHSLHWHSDVRHGVAWSQQPHSPTTYTLSVDSMPLHCLTCVGGNWCYCRELLNEKYFHLTCLWVYFIRWLLLIGAFWLYLAHLGSLRICWHVSQITRGSSHLKTSTLLWLQKLHPGTLFSGLFLLIYFGHVENNDF